MPLVNLKAWLRSRRRAIPPPAEALFELSEAFAAVAGPAAASVAAPPPRPAAEPGAWSEERIDVSEELWGDGFVTPGGAEEIRRLLGPLGLTAAASLLLVGAGGGGPTIAATSMSGCWVSGFEADRNLVAHAQVRLQPLGKSIADRAAVVPWKPAAPAFRKQGFHHAFLLDALGAEAPEPAFSALARAIKPQGQLMMLQTVSGPDFAKSEPLESHWCRLDRRAAPPPEEARVTDRLKEVGFELWVVEDVSAHHMQLAVAGWMRLVRGLKGPRPTPRRAAAIVSEAELWLTRLRLIQSGRLRVVRWHGHIGAA